MKLLTPDGYRLVDDIEIGDELVAFDFDMNEQIINTVEDIEFLKPESFDEDEFCYYLINNKWKFFRAQSVYANGAVTHAFRLNVGDTIYDAEGIATEVETIERIEDQTPFKKLHVSGNHGYIADDLAVHNLSRFLVSGGTGNWNSTTNWSGSDGGASGSSFPVNGDTVQFTTLSANANMTINVASACTSIAVQGTYAGTLTFTNTLTVAGTVTFLSTMSIAGTADLICNTTATLTAGGKTLTGGLQLKGTSQTYTLADAWVVNGLLTYSGVTAIVCNGSTLSVGGGLTVSTPTSGTTVITLTGGTWSSSATAIKNSITFAGNVTVSGNVYFNTGTLTYTSGTITTSGSTLNMNLATTLNTGSLVWNNITSTLAACAFTLSSDINYSGTWTQTGAMVFSGSFNVIGGAMTINGATTGSPTLSGTWTLSGALTLGNTTSTTFVGNFNIQAASCTISGSQTVTIVHDMNIQGITTISDANVINGAFNWNTYGLTTTGNLTGTITLIFNGTGTWTGAAGALAVSQTTVNTAGTLTVSGTVLAGTGSTGFTFTYTAGTVSWGASVLSLGGTGDHSLTITSGTFTIGSILITGASRLIFQTSGFTITTLTMPNAAFTFDSQVGVEVTIGTLTNTAYTVSRTVTWFTASAPGGRKTTVTTRMEVVSANSSAIRAVWAASMSGGTVPLILAPGATQDLGFCDPTDLSADGGQPIFTYHGTITNSPNWINTFPGSSLGRSKYSQAVNSF